MEKLPHLLRGLACIINCNAETYIFVQNVKNISCKIKLIPF